ncbi:MAG: hypothetical protein EXS13_04315 [Planctomycetes bacterium]|nr:hypothetical protein [Planctomycetota bacterium]
MRRPTRLIVSLPWKPWSDLPADTGQLLHLQFRRTRLVPLDSDHATQWPRATSSRFAAEFRPPAPGRWRIELPELPGFEAIAPITVDLDPGATREVSLTLVPRAKGG